MGGDHTRQRCPCSTCRALAHALDIASPAGCSGCDDQHRLYGKLPVVTIVRVGLKVLRVNTLQDSVIPQRLDGLTVCKLWIAK